MSIPFCMFSGSCMTLAIVTFVTFPKKKKCLAEPLNDYLPVAVGGGVPDAM